MSKLLTIAPRISEKSYLQSQSLNVYIFDVPKTSNKVQIAKAVTEQYGVTVEAVRTQITKGKAKKTNRKRSQAIKGKRSDNKTAYVTLKKGDSITVFETEGEA